MIKEEERKSVVRYSSIEKIVLEKTNVPLIILLCPNYEDRTQAVAQRISSIIDKITRPVYYLMICLKNKKNNDMVLEDLKETNIAGISSILNITGENVEWLDYPNNFSSNALRSLIDSILNESFFADRPADVLFDISTMPRSITFHLCEHISTFIAANTIGKIFFAYAQPKAYSRAHYAQDVGALKGMFSGKPLSRFDISPPSTLYWYFVTHIMWYFMSYTVWLALLYSFGILSLL